MKTISAADVTADLEAVCESIAAHRPVDPIVARRVQEVAEEVRDELRAKGPLNVAVNLLRESREE